jgi:inorganic pyrophosphatase/exopolyphosphatase
VNTPRAGEKAEVVTVGAAAANEEPLVNSSMDIFIKYLRDAKSYASLHGKPLRICLGNTSGDVDSIVGALGMAYFLTLKEGKQWVPLINCNKDELKLKPEIWEHLIVQCKIPLDAMLFYDELLSYKREHVEYAIIDHNKLDESQALMLSQGSGQPGAETAHKRVTHVYDHHVDTKHYDFTQLSDYQVRFIGSACSILVMKIRLDMDLFDQELFNPKNHPNFAYFLAAAIVLDTHNFMDSYKNRKWSLEDLEQGEWLKKFTKIDDQFFDLYQNKKFDQKVALDLGFKGNIRRDWKQYELQKGAVAGRFGCAVMVFSPDTMFAHYGHEAICKEIEATMAEKELDMFGIMCNIMESDGEMSRMVFIYSRKDTPFAKTFEGLYAATKDSKLLKCKKEVRKTFGSSEYAYWDLDNKTVSRKKYEKVFREFYQ